jgi:hypothetical protein
MALAIAEAMRDMSPAEAACNRHAASARPAHGGRFSPAGTDAGLLL